MRFRLIEKDTVGTTTEFVQAPKKKLAHSKTYIGSKVKLAVDMNKIKNTKIGDDIHYYINGVEGRGIVVKMANEYLEVFKENGQLGTIHINDTFFVKDILVNKQWNDMDDQERYEALDKIHAPTPRFIMKAWEDLPEEIKVLLTKSAAKEHVVSHSTEAHEHRGDDKKCDICGKPQKDKRHFGTKFDESTPGRNRNNEDMADGTVREKPSLPKESKKINKVGSTYEEGESKESETKDHARTGFAQNEQFSKKKPKPCKCGDPECKDPKCEKHAEVKKARDTEGRIKDRERKYGGAAGYYTSSGERKQSQAAKDREALGKNPKGSDADLMQRERERKEAEAAAKRAADKPKEEEKPKVSDKEQARLDKPDASGNYTVGGKRITNWDKKYGKYAKKKALYKSWLEFMTKPAALPKGTKPNPNLHEAFSVDDEEYKHLTPNQQKQYNQEEREREEDEPNAEEWLDIVDRIEDGKQGKKGDKRRYDQIERDEIERAKKRKETGSQPANPKRKAAPTGTGADEPGNKPSQRKLDEQKELDDSGYSMAEHDWIKGQHTRQGQADEANYGWAEGKWEGLDELTSGVKKTGKEDIIESHPNKKGPKQSTKAETYEERATQKAFEVWLERRDKSGFVTKPAALPKGTKKNPNLSNSFGEDEEHYKHLTPNQKKQYQQEQREREEDNPTDSEEYQSLEEGKQHYEDLGLKDRKEYQSISERKERMEKDEVQRHKDRKATGSQPANPTKKSEVEHGDYGNVAGSDGVGVSTDTKVDVAEDTGYEERPHISVEEAGKLPRTTFNESGSELTVTGSQDSKDKPKFSQPADQEQPVRKAGLPQQHPNTYGMRYGMKGGVKKVWCPEHQVWEETTKDWHE